MNSSITKDFPAYVITLGVKAIYLLSVKTLKENLHDIAIFIYVGENVYSGVIGFTNIRIQKYV